MLRERVREVEKREKLRLTKPEIRNYGPVRLSTLGCKSSPGDGVYSKGEKGCQT